MPAAAFSILISNILMLSPTHKNAKWQLDQKINKANARLNNLLAFSSMYINLIAPFDKHHK